jgi:GDP-mannose 6-dehydrogenase
MKVSVFGIGYVGTVTAACLAKDGHDIVGVDVSKSKVEAINSGHSPVHEPRVSEFVKSAQTKGNLQATEDYQFAIEHSEMAIVCVGTPSSQNGKPKTSSVESVVQQIGKALNETRHDDEFLVVLRSTVLPGTTRSLVIPTLESAVGKPVGSGYEVVFHPEFLREGSSVEDFYNPPRIVVGERKNGAGEKLIELYDDEFGAPLVRTTVEEAEILKYADNTFHGLKITFANEIGAICKEMNIDAGRVLEIFCMDTKLNISSKYLRPGFAFGGSCLPKDIRGLNQLSEEMDLSLPVIGNILSSNRNQIDRVLKRIMEYEPEQVGVVGVAFKNGTDDVRESPYMKLISQLMSDGISVLCYDKSVNPKNLVGHNKKYAMNVVPELGSIMVDSLNAMTECPLIVVSQTTEDKNMIRRWLSEGKIIFDLTASGIDVQHENYHPVH